MSDLDNKYVETAKFHQENMASILSPKIQVSNNVFQPSTVGKFNLPLEQRLAYIQSGNQSENKYYSKNIRISGATPRNNNKEFNVSDLKIARNEDLTSLMNPSTACKDNKPISAPAFTVTQYMSNTQTSSRRQSATATSNNKYAQKLQQKYKQPTLSNNNVGRAMAVPISESNPITP